MKAFIESILGPGLSPPRWLRAFLVGALMALALWYASAAMAHARMNNTEMTFNDQRVYMGYARSFATPGFDGFIPRMRMPLYARLLSIAARPEMTFEQFFPVAQAFNVVLSLLCLLVLFLFLRRWLGDWIGLCFCLMAAFQLFILRAGYVQPELLLTTLITLCCAQLVETLRRPVWWNALLSGLLLCAWFQTKASAQGALGIWLGVLCVKGLCAGRGQRGIYARTGIIVVLAYVLPMSSYLHTSWKVFGDPFYNLQSKYFMWCEPPTPGKEYQDEKHMLQKLGIDRSLERMPADPSELPSAGKYLKRHTYKEIKARLQKGLKIMFKLVFLDYAVFCYLLGVWAAVAGWAISRHWRDAFAGAMACKWEILFVAGLVTVFTLLFGWFVPLRAGPRLVESISLVPAFFCGAVAHFYLKDEVESVAGVRISMERLFVLGFLILWAVLTVQQAPLDLKAGYFGG